MLTEGRLNDGTIPNLCSIASMVAPFIGEPLSECNTKSCMLIPSDNRLCGSTGQHGPPSRFHGFPANDGSEEYPHNGCRQEGDVPLHT